MLFSLFFFLIYIYSILISYYIYAQILQIRGLLMSDVYTPLEARLLKYFNTPEISSQFNTVIIIKLP